MNVLEFFVKMVELVEMKLVDIPVNAFLDLQDRTAKQVRHYLVTASCELIETDRDGTVMS